MIALEVLHELYTYNYWARDRQLQTCAALTPEQFLQPLGSSFSSVRDTLVHLMAVEWLWLERWLGRSPTKQDTLEFAPEKFPALDTIREKWNPIEAGVQNYLRNLSAPELLQPLTYTKLQGHVGTYPLWRVLIHMVNHQTYHRGQITTLLRQLQVPVVAVDYLVAHDLHFAK
jgi:uncharacterized damage-inducible protein DinB